LDLPSQLGIQNVINVNNIKLFEPPLLNEIVTITHPMENIPDFQFPLLHDSIIHTKHHSTHKRVYISYLLACKGKHIAQSNWMTTYIVQNMFPRVLDEAGTLPTLNREEFAHKEAIFTYNPINKMRDNVIE